VRRLLSALVAVLAVVAVAAPSASAHALLQDSTPARGATLKTAPDRVVLRFNEPVEVAFGSVRVFDAEGRQVEQGDPFHPDGDGLAVAVRVRDDLPRGGYTVTYRVISADAHPVSGGFVFAVGSGAAPAATVDELLAGQDAGPATRVAFAVVRALEFAAIAVGIGALAVLLLAWLPGLRAAVDVRDGAGVDDWRAASAAFARRLRILLLAAAAVGALAGVAALGLQAATAEGSSFWSALGEIDAVLATRFGMVWGIGVLAWAVVLVLAAARPAAVPALRPATVGAAGVALPSAGLGIAALAVPLLTLAFLPGLGGHAGVQSPVAVLLPANVVHVLAASAWIGGVAVLVAALPAATRKLAPEGRTRLLAAVMPRFSTLALVAVIALLVGGILQSVLMLTAVDDLVDTAFGRAILVKIGLVVVLLAAGLLHRRRILPALERAAAAGDPPGRPGVLLRRVLRVEVALGVAALAATGALAGYAPADAQPVGPFSASASLGPARAELTVEPARPGPNEVHLYLFDRRDGRQYDAPKEVRIEAALPERSIEPLKIAATKAGPGHYVVSGAALSPPGDWELEVVARVSAFDELRTGFEVPIR
jgi:copper transport protein